ncbi:MAG: cyanoexosortase B system-associated protein [Leptolyngbya foveolarum]|uniref:Cyanoexosortase B system-associated protein n=1 Tax=Leptolyngbya foveolarum TaxID=47253 RepID=A0A2W4WUJ8_9CYAN|nr:MAG: cyanoexosortase B system-associated protein [Leptolyngbya foveolarum]
MSSPTLSQKASKKSFVPFLVVAILALFVAIGALPRYLGDWPWVNNPTVPNKSALIAVKEQGLPIPGWQTQEQTTTKLGGQTWSIQQLATEPEIRGAIAPESPDDIFLLLRSQVWYADQPEVEWVDIQGSQRWKIDSRQQLSFSASRSPSDQTPDSAQPVPVNSDFFRAWNQNQTYAVLQWYAWPTGGSPSPASWFWTDQISQWQRNQRTPWVAVSLWLPIEPFSDISLQRAMAESLGKTVQATLLDTVFLDTEPS